MIQPYTRRLSGFCLLLSSFLWLSCSTPEEPTAASPNAFVGSYKGKMVLTITTTKSVVTQTWDPVTVTIRQGAKTDEVKLVIGTTVGDYNDPWTATTSSTKLTMPRQQASGDPYAFEGSGTLTGKQYTMTVQQTEVGRTTTDTYQYQITATQQ